MNLRNLRYFCAAYEQGSTVGASRVCHVTQPAISAAIAQLEDELGVRLFLRQQRGLAPTPAAERLHGLAGKLLADAQAITASFRSADRLRWVLRLLPSLDGELTRRLLRHWRQALPELDLVIAGEGEPADAELTAAGCRPEGSEFLALWREDYALVVPDDHPLAVQAVIGVGDLHRVAFVERTHCELSRSWHEALGPLAVVPDVRARVAGEAQALALVGAGVGVTIAPLHAVARHPGVVVRSDVPQLQGLQREIGLAWHPLRPGAAHAHPALERVLDICRQWQAWRWAPLGVAA